MMDARRQSWRARAVRRGSQTGRDPVEQGPLEAGAAKVDQPAAVELGPVEPGVIEQPGRVDSERDLGRLVTFTDAVVAIAITLIVLPLVESAREHATEPAIDYLRSDALNILAAALSFVVIATFWKQHHRLYKHVEVPTRGLVNANLLWLAGIIFLPVPSVLTLGNPDADALGSAIYVFTILVSQVGVRIQELLLVRGDCFEPGFAPVSRYLWAHWITVALTVVALGLTIAFPNLGPFTLVLLLFSRPINAAVRRGQTALERERRIL